MQFYKRHWISAMTVCPQSPNLGESQREGYKTLLEPHLTFVPMGFGFCLSVLIKEGLETDGATIPKDELEKSDVIKKICKLIAKHYPGKDYKETLSYLIGTPFEMPRLCAAIVHDALYGMKWKCRWICDMVYRAIQSSIGYDKVRKGIEYSGIRMFGGKSWEAVTKEEKEVTKKLVDVKIVLERNKEKIKDRLLSQYCKKI